MVDFSAKFVGSNPGHWELYADGVRVATFSVEEIAGVHSNNKDALYLIVNELGCYIELYARVLRKCKRIVDNSTILPILRKVVQNYVESCSLPNSITKE